MRTRLGEERSDEKKVVTYGTSEASAKEGSK